MGLDETDFAGRLLFGVLLLGVATLLLLFPTPSIFSLKGDDELLIELLEKLFSFQLAHSSFPFLLFHFRFLFLFFFSFYFFIVGHGHCHSWFLVSIGQFKDMTGVASLSYFNVILYWCLRSESGWRACTRGRSSLVNLNNKLTI